MSARRALALLLALAACQSEPAVVPDAAVAADVATATDAGTDAGTDVTAPAVDGGGPCSFNRDCIAAERCECDEATGCRCAPGARGAGVAGVTVCASGNDCASALCVDATSGSLCSDACATAADCPAALPRCLSISGVGMFCARDPSARDAGVGGTALAATFGARRAGFERAQHGVLADGRLIVEAHSGGDPACPTMTSPTPRRTLALRNLRATADATPQTQADGLTAVLFDFGGDLTTAPLLRASAVRVVPSAYMANGSVSFAVTATFSEGTITGTVVAPHCDSLDD
jgi:predicted small lipoprotein YifL